MLGYLAALALIIGTGDAQATTGVAARGNAVVSSDPQDRIDKSIAGKGTPEAITAEPHETARTQRPEH